MVKLQPSSRSRMEPMNTDVLFSSGMLTLHNALSWQPTNGEDIRKKFSVAHFNLSEFALSTWRMSEVSAACFAQFADS